MQYAALPLEVAGATQIVKNCRWGFSTKKLMLFLLARFCVHNWNIRAGNEQMQLLIFSILDIKHTQTHN